MELVTDGTEVFERCVQRLEAYLYADDGILVSNQAARLHWYVDELTEMFDQVGLHTNVDKMVSMDFQPCHMLWNPLLRPTSFG